MGRRSHLRDLHLYMNGELAGVWSLSPQRGDVLQYDAGWVNSAQGRPLSLSLPFMPGNTAHTGAHVRAYFENLLPDSREILDRLGRHYQIGSADAFDLLGEIGRDCVGALQIQPVALGAPSREGIDATPLNDAEIAQLLRNALAPGIRGLGHEDDFRISIAGAQEKTALLYLDGQWCRPHGSTPTTHIFKLPLGLVGGLQFDLSESVENEWLCSLILKAYGLPVATCQPLQFEDVKVLAVERFDRLWWQGAEGTRRLIRLPQEDMCQAMGVYPAAKYEADGGPGMDSILKLLDTSMTPEHDRRIFFQAQLIFWMLCATDGHAKNFSLFLRPGGRYQLTPLYDVLSAWPVLGEGPGRLSPFKARMAMAVRTKNAHWKMHEILRRHWLGVGERNGIVTSDGRAVAGVIDDLVGMTPAVIQTVRQQLPNNFLETVAGPILNGLQEAANRLKAA